MKKLIFTLTLAVICSVGMKAQQTLSATYRSYCTWNDTIKKFNSNCPGKEESSLFEFTKNESMFIHTIAEMKSTYYIKSKEWDAKNEVMTYDVLSDIGNEYFVVVDIKHKDAKEVRIAYVSNGTTIMVRFTIKEVW